MAIVITRALKAVSTLASVATERRVSATANVAFNDAGLTLAIIALRQRRVFAMGVLCASHTIGPVITHDTEGRELKASDVGLGIAGATSAIYADPVKALAIIIVHTLCTAHPAVRCHHAERCVYTAPGVITWITGDAVIPEALTKACLITLRVIITGDALIAVISFDADPERAVAPAVTA